MAVVTLTTPQEVFALIKKGAPYPQQAFTKRVSPNFTWGEVIGRTHADCWKEITLDMLENAVVIAKELEVLRKAYNNTPIIISSWLRTPTHNARASTGRTSTGRTGPHTKGWAVDFLFKGLDNVAIFNQLAKSWNGGYAIRLDDKGKPVLIHLDKGPRRTWRY